MTERITFIDFGRVVSIFCVIILHVCLGSYYLFSLKYDLNWSVTLFYYTLSRVSVPVFVMISGVTTIWLKKQCNQVVTVSSALYRISKLIIPIFFWSVVYLLLLDQYTPIALFKILWSPQGLVHLWFLYMLIGLYLLSPFISLIFNSKYKEYIRYSLLLWFIFACVNVYTEAFFGVKLGEWFGLLPNYQSGFVGYYILGAYMMTFRPISLSKSIIVTIAGAALSYFLVVWDNHNAPVFNDRLLNFLAPNIVMMSFGLFSLLRCFDFSWFSKYHFSFISPLVVGIYLTHEMILKFFREALGLVGYGYNAFYFVPLLAIATFIVALLFSFLLSLVQQKLKLFF